MQNIIFCRQSCGKMSQTLIGQFNIRQVTRDFFQGMKTRLF